MNSDKFFSQLIVVALLVAASFALVMSIRTQKIKSETKSVLESMDHKQGDPVGTVRVIEGQSGNSVVGTVIISPNPLATKVIVSADPGVPSVEQGQYDVTLTAEDGTVCAAADYRGNRTAEFVIFQAWLDFRHGHERVPVKLACHWRELLKPESVK